MLRLGIVRYLILVCTLAFMSQICVVLGVVIIVVYGFLQPCWVSALKVRLINLVIFTPLILSWAYRITAVAGTRLTGPVSILLGQVFTYCLMLITAVLPVRV